MLMTEHAGLLSTKFSLLLVVPGGLYISDCAVEALTDVMSEKKTRLHVNCHIKSSSII